MRRINCSCRITESPILSLHNSERVAYPSINQNSRKENPLMINLKFWHRITCCYRNCRTVITTKGGVLPLILIMESDMTP
jgi:hypothetical protein